MKKWNVQKLVMTAMLAAVAGVLMSLEFSIPFMPTFYKIDFSTMPSIIALFSMGPLSAFCVEMIKLIIKVITVGSNSAYVGELANVLDALIFVGGTWLIYTKLGKTKKAVFIALISGVIFRTAWACFCNAFITLPLYAKAYGMSIDNIVQMVSTANKNISDLTSFIMFATIPFNIIKIGLNYSVGYIIMDRIAKANPSLKFIYETKEAHA